jgi:DNA-binding winged helix-turn-helix (wHTH) protein/tetratricopeptide (TPR) repeat protein
MRYGFGDFVFDSDGFLLLRSGESVSLQPRVLEVLRYFIEHRGRMIAKAELLDALWPEQDVNEGVVSWSVSHIRRALGQQRSDGHPIETVHGRGYRFVADVKVLPAPAPSPQPVPLAPSAAPLVGRAQALAELEQCVREAELGRGGLLVITGESGIGKTRCAQELVERCAARGVRVLWGRCLQSPSPPPLWPLAAALRELAGEPAARMRKLVSSLREHGDVAAPERDAAARFLALEGVARCLRELASEQPLLWVLDDLHWADAATLQWLGLIAPELSGLRACVVATLRDGERETGSSRDRLLLQALRHARTIPLGALSSQQIAELIAASCPGKASAELAEAVRRASGGVPLFVREVVRSLLRQHDAADLERLRPEAVQVPALARDVLRERLRQLPRATIEALFCAAVIGDQLELSLLTAMLEIEPETLLDRLAPALAEGLLVSEVAHVCRFTHALFQSVLYDEIPAGQRAALHRKLGDLLVQRPASAANAGEIARHYHCSLSASTAGSATRYARSAGEAAVRELAFDAAVLYFGWAVQAQLVADVDSARSRAELLLALGRAQRAAGRTGDATDTAARVIEIAMQHGTHDLTVAATRLRRASVALATFPDNLARTALEQVLAQSQADDAASAAVRISAMSQLACVPPYERDLARSKQLSAQAAAEAEQHGERELLFEALRARLFALSGPDDVDEAVAVAERMLSLERAGERTWQIMDARVALVAAHLHVGRVAAADAALAQAEASLRGRWGEAAFYCQRMRAQRCFLDGDFELAHARWKDAFDYGARAGVSYAEAVYEEHTLGLELEREGAAWVFDRRLRGRSSLRRLPRAQRASLSRIAAEAGELAHVRAELAALGDPSDYTRDGAYLNTLASLAVCAVALSDRPRCEQLYALLSPYPAHNTPDMSGYYLGSVSHFLGLLAGALGRNDEALAFLQRALEHNRAMGYRAGTVRTLLALAEIEQRGGQTTSARARRLAARDEARALGMRSTLERVEAALAD